MRPRAREATPLTELLTGIHAFGEKALTSGGLTAAGLYWAAVRFLLPVLAFFVLFRCAKPLLTFRREPEIWAWLNLPDGNQLPITHWENIIGRHKRSDIVVDFPTISRSHAVLTRYDDGSWTIRDIGSKGGVSVNGKQVEICALEEGDIISLGGLDMTLEPITKRQEVYQTTLRTKAGRTMRPWLTLMILTAFQLLVGTQLLFTGREEDLSSIAFGFLALAAMEWLLYLSFRAFNRRGFELETMAFFLSTMGMAAICTVSPGEAKKQIVAMALGIVLFLVVGWSLRDLERAKKMRYLAAAAGLGLLAVNLVFGVEMYGAKNWIFIGSMSLQPSELVKVCFVFAGASAMDRIVAKRNLILFIAYSAIVCGCLALMNDFGSALIFFCAFLIIAYLRSGNLGTIALICAAVGIAGIMVLKFRPHALSRFSAWRHIWEDPYGKGYQQTRALMCLAAGGLLGLGGGNGYLKNVFAADADIVFATISEEWGLLIAMMMVAAIVCMGVFVVRSASVGRSSFYTIGACAAVSIFMVQTLLNAFGTVDLLPFTGVTFPFVSNGGSSMLSCWGLLAFMKAVDTRQNASFAIRLPSKKEAMHE